MKTELSLESLQKSMSHFFSRFHFIIFFVFVSGGLVIAIYFLNAAIASSDPSNATAASSSAFDQATIDRLQKLSEPGTKTRSIQPQGRVSPF